MVKLVVLPALALGALAFVGTRPPLAPVPEYRAISEPMTLEFGISKIAGGGVELGLKGGAARGPLFLQFDVAIEDGAPVVTLNGAGSRSAMAGKAPGDDLPDWSFLKNSDGGTVLDFSFENQLVELEGGQQAVRMTYVGPTVPLLRTLRVSRPTTMPPFVAAALGVSGPIRLEPGDYPIDTEGAATINARLLGR